MDYKEIDIILRSTLSPTETPSEVLNHEIIKKMEERRPMKWSNISRVAVACIIILMLVIPTSIYAAQRLLSPKDVAHEVGDNKLSDSFKVKGIETYQTETDGTYKVTYLGYVNGKSMSERTGSAWKLNPDRTYVAVAIERIDGTVISDRDNLFVTPLIQGLKPWVYNIATMNGSYTSKVVDGVLYRIIECDNIEIFADKKLYLAVSDTAFYSVDAYVYDEKTGEITVNKAYSGTNILFPMELDPSKADSKKAKAYIKQFEDEWNSHTEDMDNNMTDKPIDDVIGGNKSDLQQEKLYKDDENGIKFRIKYKDNGWGCWSGWWSCDQYSGTTFSYYLTVEGDGIQSLTYTLNNGEFCYWPENDVDARKLYGSKYSISYDDQDKIDYFYSININAIYKDYGYDEEYLKKLGNKDSNARDQLYHDLLNEAIETTTVALKIKMKDGSIVKKLLSFKNLEKENGNGFCIDVSLK